MIRPATMKDLDKLLDIGEEFISSTKWTVECKREDLKETLQALISLPEEEGIIFVAVKDGKLLGTLAAIQTPCFWNFDHRESKEIFWWVTPEHRKGNIGHQLFQAFERWSGHYKADDITIASIGLEDFLGGFYQSQGYTKSETLYLKELPGQQSCRSVPGGTTDG